MARGEKTEESRQEAGGRKDVSGRVETPAGAGLTMGNESDRERAVNCGISPVFLRAISASS